MSPVPAAFSANTRGGNHNRYDGVVMLTVDSKTTRLAAPVVNVSGEERACQRIEQEVNEIWAWALSRGYVTDNQNGASGGAATWVGYGQSPHQPGQPGTPAYPGAPAQPASVWAAQADARGGTGERNSVSRRMGAPARAT